MNRNVTRWAYSRRRFLKLTGVIGGGAVLAACQPADPTSQPTAAATSAAATTAPTQPPAPQSFTARLAVEQASVPDFAEIPQVWAQRSGLFAENGVDLELIETGGGSGVAAEPLQMLVSEQIDFTDVLFPAGFEVISAGAPLKGLGAFASGLRYDYWMVAKTDIQDWADLVGRKYVISSPGGPPDGIGRYAMARYGVDAGAVEFVPLGGSSARTQALLAGEVDAALVHPLDALQLVKDNSGIHVMSRMEDAPLVFGIDSTFASNIETQRGMVVAYVKTVIQAVRRFIDDRDFAIQTCLEFLPEADPELVGQTWQDFIDRGVWDPNMALSQDLYEATMQAYVEIGALPEAVAWSDFMDPTIVEEALEDLGRR